jgi:hypothetical protein
MTTNDDLLSTISYHIEETRRMITETGKSRSAVKRDGALTRLLPNQRSGEYEEISKSQRLA